MPVIKMETVQRKICNRSSSSEEGETPDDTYGQMNGQIW